MTESKLALPHLIIGLGSEMINVLNNRIEAQKIPLQKADQLRQGLVRYLYSEKFIDEMLTPQKIYPLNSAQDIFKKLLMLSVLKTDHSGWQKIFKIMISTFKSKVMRMSYPEEIADMTVKYMNHIKTLVLNSNEESLVKSAIQKLIVKYDLCKSAGFFRIKIELLNCLQGKNSKISTMLKSGVQLADGNFMIDNSHASPGTQRPGDVSIFTNGSLRSQINFVLCLTNKYQANSTSIRRSNVEISRYHIVDQKESIPISSDSLRVSIARWELGILSDLIVGEEEDTYNLPIDFGLESSPSLIENVEEEKTTEENKARLDNSRLEKIIMFISEDIPDISKEEDLFELLDQ